MGFARDEMAKSVAAQISEFGQDMVLRRLSSATYNSATGTVTPTPSDLPIRATIVSYNKEDIDGDNVLASDRKAYIQVSASNTPKEGDKLVGVGIDALIVAIHNILRTNTETIVCICQARS